MKHNYPPRSALLDRLADKFLIGDGCWEWTGRLNKDGYGVFQHDGSNTGHRAVYRLMVGEIPEGTELDHLCRNRSCVRPDHLEPVVHIENVRRGRVGRFNATKTHCPQGHPYSGDNLYVAQKEDGTEERQCLECRRRHSREYQRRRRAAQCA